MERRGISAGAGRDLQRLTSLKRTNRWRFFDEKSSQHFLCGRHRFGGHDPLAPYPHLKRLFQTVEARPAVARARAAGKDHDFKKVNDEETKRALFPSNYPTAA